MDPISIIGLAASVEQLSEAAANIVSNMYKYYEAVRDAPKRSKELRQEMGAMSDQLNDLVHVVSSTPTMSTCNLHPSFISSIKEFQTMLDEMNDRVQVSKIEGRGRFKWPFTKDQNDRLLQRMERYKQMLNMTLNIQTA